MIAWSACIFVALATLIIGAVAQTASADENSIPTRLFGIELGRAYEISADGRLKGAPIKKFTGIEKFLGEGISYYFEPSKEYKEFSYIEENTNNAEFFKTSFRLYLLPAISDFVSLKEDAAFADLHWEVALIEWYDRHFDDKDADEAYWWAVDMCKSVRLDLEMTPTEDVNHLESKLRRCNFEIGERVLVVESFTGKHISLEYPKEYFRSKSEALEEIRRRNRMDEIRPYSK